MIFNRCKTIMLALLMLAMWFPLTSNSGEPMEAFIAKLEQAGQMKDWIMEKYSNNVDASKAQAIANNVVMVSIDTGISAELMTGLISVESSFRTNARSNMGAVGLTQVVPKWHRGKLKDKNLNRVHDSIVVGAQVLKECLDKHQGHVVKALKCYNGDQGPGGNRYARSVLAKSNDVKRHIASYKPRGTLLAYLD